VARRGGFADDALSSMQEGEEEGDAFPLSYTRSGIGLVGWSLGRARWLRRLGYGQVGFLSFFLFLFFLFLVSAF
jgi:hypothetical protein